MDKITMLALPVVLPKIKGFDIIEGDIEDDGVTEKNVQLPSSRHRMALRDHR